MNTMAHDSARELFVADVCHTLYASNTTFDFVRYVTRRRAARWQPALFAVACDTRSPLVMGLIAAQKFISVDVPRLAALSFLRGVTAEDLWTMAREFVRDTLGKRIIAGAHLEVERARSRGARIMIMSASIDPVVSAVAETLGAEYRCSRLAVRNGACLGRLEFDLSGRKAEELAQVRGGSASVTVMSDNVADRPLFQAADRRIVVIGREADRARWADLATEFIIAGNGP